ncbi:MAG: hypothetical protein FWD53_09595 [Phycisphaerales bacterium]|nr:hypothetical protein [Phycisphaerales bacterium]
MIRTALTAVLLMSATASAQVVSNINITSDKTPDVSSIEAWRNHFIKPGMSDKEKALAVWKTVVAYQHQNPPPKEFLHSPGDNVVDPIKMFNVYGYGYCSVHAAHVAALARAAGLKSQNRAIIRHNVAEVFFDGQWRMLDASLVNYFLKPDGSIASVDEIIAATSEFYQKYPNLKNNPAGLDQFRKDGKWKTEGPPLLNSPFYNDQGLADADWPWQCGWMETMTEYNGGSKNIYEDGYSMGYRVNVQLRPGEKIIRNWSNKGLFGNMDIPLNEKGKGPGQPPPALNLTPGEGPMRYLKNVEGGTLPPGRIGNGVHAYAPPLASLATSALTYDNLTVKNNTLQPADPTKPATLIIRMPTSYVYLGGELKYDPITLAGDGGNIKVSISDNNGLDWQVCQVTTIAAGQARSGVDLKSSIFRRYDYRLKFEFNGPVGMQNLNITHDIQHSQAPLPALAQGENTLTFSAGNEGTITVEPSTKAVNKDKQLIASDFHPTKENVDGPMLSVKGPTGWIEFPITTPAPMKRLRIFTFYCARGDGDSWTASVSFDGGKTYRDLGKFDAPHRFMEKQITVSDIPANTTSALVRFTGTNKTAALLYNLRLDADYPEPHGGFRPVKITYAWSENGTDKTHTHIARSPRDTWKINCAAKPLLKSYTVELE